MELGERLKDLRESRGWKQRNVGDKLNVSRSAISKFENGKQIPSIDILKQYEQLFQVEPGHLVSELIGGTTSKENKPAYYVRKADDSHDLDELYKRNPKLKPLLLELDKYPLREQQRATDILETIIKGLNKS
jgi:transcriptional regulator with XRE-family HTH domain